MSDTVVTAILSFLAIGIIGWIIKWGRGMLDRYKVYNWLKSNTRDEPGESHTDTVTLAKSTSLSEERIHRACMSDKRIHYYSDKSEQWSIWRKEPQSVYEKRGPLKL